MIPKLKEKREAINLRKKGLSYREILIKVSVAKSTLSLWLRSVGLSKKQQQRLTYKKLQAAHRGAQKKKEQRIITTKVIQEKAIKEIKTISKKDLWLMGIMLYWAEGAKAKEWRTGVGVKFSNSDPKMIKIFLIWLETICHISIDAIKFEIYIHENSINPIKTVKKYWSTVLQKPLKHFQTVYLKRNIITTKRHNTQKKYYGLVTVRVNKSINLNRRISGWIEGIYQYYQY